MSQKFRLAQSDVKDYVVFFFNRVEEVEAGITVEPVTMIPGFTGKICLAEPNYEQKRQGYISVFDLLEMADDALKSINKKTWVIFDRLDVSFSEKPEIERVAIRTLFQVYNDLKSYESIKLKIFIRDDIWQRIISGGFREASHIIKSVTIKWNEENLRHLIVSRILDNNFLINEWSINRTDILADAAKQEELFYRVFPDQIDSGQRKPNTFNWMLTRIQDGLSVVAPRELIQLINEAKKKQINELETGDSLESNLEFLIGRKALKSALEVVSELRLKQTIYAEYYHLKKYIEKLEGQKAEQTVQNLGVLFSCDEKKANEVAEELCSIGIFEKKSGYYWTPFLYRPALNLTQGKEL